jgi:hypothetical protein
MTDEEMDKIAQRTIKRFLRAEAIGYNNALEWAAKWIENSGNSSEEIKQFASNMAMSIRANKRKDRR